MAEKVRTKNNSEEQLQAINDKLDFLINEVQDIRREMNDLQSKNNEQLYKLDSQFYRLCSDLQSQIYKFQSEFYSGNRKINDELKSLHNKKLTQNTTDKISPWSPMVIVGGGIIWAMVLWAILS